jgi:hypothetical protein
VSRDEYTLPSKSGAGDHEEGRMGIEDGKILWIPVKYKVLKQDILQALRVMNLGGLRICR